MNKRRFDIAATFACIAVLACWTVGPISIKYLSSYIDSWTQNLLRYSVGCLFWLPFLLFTTKRKQIDAKLWRKALLPAAANVTMQSLWAAGFYYVGPAFMALLAKSSVIWIAGFSLIFFADERGLVRSKRFWLGLAFSVIGVVGVIYYKQDFAASGTIIGIAIALACAFMWAVYTLSVRMAFRDTDSRSGFSVISIYTVAGLFVLGLIFGGLSQCVTMGTKRWAVVVISAVIAIALGHVLYYAAMRRIGATIPSLVILAQPFSVLAISNVIFGELLNSLQLLSGVVLLAGSALAIWAQQHLRRDS
ncbi:MAG: DMT family transporter [Sedimentisphaerales bacterium]